MARQIRFYMLPEDRDAFLYIARKNAPVEVTLRDSELPEALPAVGSDMDGRKTLCLWNRGIVSHIHRKWIPDPGYYRLDEFKECILEFTPSLLTTWEGKPALIQERLYGIFDGKPPAFEKWYDTLVRWIRKNYRRSPAMMGGYVGPAASKFCEMGGYLLPNFLPPRTEEWLAEINKQHPPKMKPENPETRGQKPGDRKL